MDSFKKYHELRSFILEMAEQCFSLNEAYAAVREDEIYYVKEPQVISLSTHALKDGIDKGRLWWTNAKDVNFTNFADKVLDKLKHYDTLPEKGSNGITKPERHVDTKLGVCDHKEMKGWVIALQESRNEEKSLDSCHVVTILNKHNTKTMNPNAPLFAKADLYIANVDKTVKPVTNEYSPEAELTDINSKLKELEAKHDDLYLEYEYEEDVKLKFKKKKEYESLVRQIEQLKNRKNKLSKNESVDVYTVASRSLNKTVHIILI